MFYSFNGNMEHDELVRQLRELAAQGVTGFFVHARAGLEIAYMQEEWFACFQLCVDTAEELGMSVYIYDENGWAERLLRRSNSGAGGGISVQIFGIQPRRAAR